MLVTRLIYLLFTLVIVDAMPVDSKSKAINLNKKPSFKAVNKVPTKKPVNQVVKPFVEPRVQEMGFHRDDPSDDS